MSDKNPDYPGIFYLLGKMYLDLGENEPAREALTKQIEIDNRHGGAKIHLATYYYRIGQIGNATDSYLTELKQVSDMELINELGNYFRWLLKDDEKSSFFSMSPENQASYMADFWRDRDSNMMTPENERLIEHIRRSDFVKKQYHLNNDRCFDDRGEIYLKYDEPDNKHIDVMPFVPGVTQHIYPNESWLYDSIDTYMAFDFINKAAGFEIVPDLSYSITPHSIWYCNISL